MPDLEVCVLYGRKEFNEALRLLQSTKLPGDESCQWLEQGIALERMLLVDSVPEDLPGAVSLGRYAEAQVPVGEAGREPVEDLDATKRAGHQPIRIAFEAKSMEPAELVSQPERRMRADITLDLGEHAVRPRGARVAEVMPAPTGDLCPVDRVREGHARDVDNDGTQPRQPGIERLNARCAHLEALAGVRVEPEGGQGRRAAGQERRPRLLGERRRLAQATEGGRFPQAGEMRQLPRCHQRLDQGPLGCVEPDDGDPRHHRIPIPCSARDTRMSARVS